MMIRRRAEAGLTPWIERARASLVASFANGVTKDEAAVRAAITLPWSNGQTEGQITRLKLVRRQTYGRGKIDLLQARLIGADEYAAPKLRRSQFWTPIPRLRGSILQAE
jgi:transposase